MSHPLTAALSMQRRLIEKDRWKRRLTNPGSASAEIIQQHIPCIDEP